MMYRVKDWNDRFESAKSRTYKVKTQTYMPNKMGLGYSRVVRGADGPAIYGAWCAVIGMLSRMEAPRHGYLTDTGRADGRALTAVDIEHLTQLPASICVKMLAICASQDVGWLEDTDAKDTTVSLPRIPHGPSPLPLPSPLPSPLTTTTACGASDSLSISDNPDAAPHDRIAAAVPSHLQPPSKADILTWAHAHGVELSRIAGQVVADLRAEPPNRWAQYGALLVKYAIGNAAKIYERKQMSPARKGSNAKKV